MAALKDHAFFMGFFILATFSITSIYALECFDGCVCYWAAERFEADCSNRDLEKYPNSTSSTTVSNDNRIDVINFSNNKLLEFPYHLSKIDDLTFIDLTNNHIKKLKPNALNGFKTLRTLFLNGNNLSTWNDINPNTAFKGAKNLETLSLANNPITSFSNVDETFLIVSHSIIVLDLGYCEITKLSGEFMLSGLTALEHLILNGNPLKLLTPLMSDTLKVFDLSNCNIEACSPDALISMPNLIHLNLSHNNGIHLKNQNDEFVSSASLLILDLSNCNLDVVETIGFPILSTLIFSGNLLKKLTPTTFKGNEFLQSLDLSRNSINYIDSETFNDLQLLKKLDLSYNVISNIDSNMFIMNSLLISLNLSQNFLSRFHKIISHSLIHLFLNSNDISKIDTNALSSLKNLSILDLSYNVFTIFPNGMVSATLQVLDLSMCRIIKISNKTFERFPELSKLDLSGNRFTKTFKVSYFQNNHYLQEIRLYDNLWECNCQDKDFQQFYSFYMQRRMSSTRLRDTPQCGHPTNSIENTWGQTCKHIWASKANMGMPEKIWTIIFCTILASVGLLCFFLAFRRVFKGCKGYYNQRILRRNVREDREIRRMNNEVLQHQGFQNAPTFQPRESSPPCYEDALLMPKIDRSKSMGELNKSNERNKERKLQRANTNADLENENNLIIDHNRFLSEERLLDREKERSSNFGYNTRRQQRGLSTGHRLTAIELNYDSKFPPAHMRSQNLESAERIAVLKNSRASPYSSRKWKMHADSVSFASISDDELGVHRNSVRYSKDGADVDSIGHPKQSPYSRRRPRGLSVSQLSISRENLYDEIPASTSASNPKIVVVENHFNEQNDNKSSDTIKSSISSGFDKIQIPSKELSLQSINSEISSKNDSAEQMVVVNLPIKQSKF